MRAPVVPLLAGLLLAGCGPGADQQELTAEEASAMPVHVLVFDFAEGEHGLLAPHAVPVTQDGSDEALLAVRALLDDEPAPGRSSLWHGMCRPGDGVASVERTASLVTVTLEDFVPGKSSGYAMCDLSERGWQLQRQQVAWAVRAATHEQLPVRVVGEQGNELLPETTAQQRWLDRASLTRLREPLDLRP